MLKDVYHYFQYASLLVALLCFIKFKSYTFYKYLILYLAAVIIFETLGATFFKGNNKDNLFNIYTFFEFNLFALIYYNLIKVKSTLKVLKIVILIFNSIYFISFYFVSLQNYTVAIEGIVNSAFVVLYFRELLNSTQILNYNRLLSFWVSVGFLLFYLSSIPFFTLLYLDVLDNRYMYPLLYSLIIVFNVCFIYGMLSCKKMNT